MAALQTSILHIAKNADCNITDDMKIYFKNFNT